MTINPDWDGVMKAQAREPKAPKVHFEVSLGGDLQRVIRHLVALAQNHQAPHPTGCGLCTYALSLGALSEDPTP